jgi:hypothetical protein
MSREDAPNLRSIDPDKTCHTCNNSLWFNDDGDESHYDVHRCCKYDFVIDAINQLVCDDWEEVK